MRFFFFFFFFFVVVVVAEYDSLGDTDSESDGCHFGTLEHFLILMFTLSHAPSSPYN